MESIKGYLAVTAEGIDQLNEKVNVQITKGFQPLGSLIVTVYSGKPIFLQTKVKY